MIEKINRGPLFIVGMPRSGTKLLRNLLNQHPKVSIDPVETVFLPLWYRNWSRYGDLGNFDIFSKFYQKNLRSRYMRIRLKSNRLVNVLDWYQACDSFDTAGVFEGLLRTHLNIDKNADVIWGDKTPSYLVHIPLIKKIYPHAQIIHIIRDVRDYCLSLNHAWKKNMLRGAQRWVDYVNKARSDGESVRGYLEVRYEALLTEPEREMKAVCEFLGIEFVKDMLTLSRPSEKFGDAKGKAFIVQNNTRKYETRMSPAVQHAIEEISCELLSELGYTTTYRGPARRIGRARMQFYKLIDGINLILQGKIQNLSDVKSSGIHYYGFSKNK